MEGLKRSHDKGEKNEKHEKSEKAPDHGDLFKKLMHRLEELEEKVEKLTRGRGGDFFKELPREWRKFDFKNFDWKDLEKKFRGRRNDDDDDKDKDFLFRRFQGEDDKFEFKLEGPYGGRQGGKKKVIIEKKDDCDDCDKCEKKVEKKTEKKRYPW
jgi:hypothetical protein